MGWQIPICQKERSPLKKVSLPAFAESEFGNIRRIPNPSLVSVVPMELSYFFFRKL